MHPHQGSESGISADTTTDTQARALLKRGYIGIMEKKMETTGNMGIAGYVLGLFGVNGKEN